MTLFLVVQECFRVGVALEESDRAESQRGHPLLDTLTAEATLEGLNGRIGELYFTRMGHV